MSSMQLWFFCIIYPQNFGANKIAEEELHSLKFSQIPHFLKGIELEAQP